jgi:ABC-type sugar transport system ATPase subunit
MVELGPFLDRRPAALSGGQRQRVALARAIVREPNAFLMDEPLSNLDAKLRVSTRAQIKHLHHTLRRTTIYVTHDQIEAMTLADRVVVMNHGVVQQLGTPTEIYDRPANTFVASFIGSPAMNLVQGEIQDGIFRAEGIAVPAQGKGPVTLGFRAEDVRVSDTPAQLTAPSTRWNSSATPPSSRSASARRWSPSARPRTSASTSARLSTLPSPQTRPTFSTQRPASACHDGLARQADLPQDLPRMSEGTWLTR